MHSTLGAYFQSDNFIMEAYSKGRDKTSSISKLNWVHIESLWVVVLETSPEDKYWNETNSYIMITNIYPSGNCWHVARRPHDHCAVALGLPQDDRPMSVRFYGPCKGIVGRPCGLPTTISRVYDHFFGPNNNLKPCVVLTITVRCVRGLYDVTAMCLRATGLRFNKFVIVQS